MTGAADRVRAEIARQGSVPVETLVELALYDPEAGFYAVGGQAGRRGDFLTSPEVGPLFGAVVARALDRWWREAGEPPSFVVVEAGAGPGALARTVLAAKPACARALRYVLVERSDAQRAVHAEQLPLESPAAAFATPPDPDETDAASVPLPPGPIVVSLGDLPRLPPPVVVLANELLDNLPFGLLERTPSGWAEVRITVGDPPGEPLEELLAPTPVDPEALAPVGARVPTQAAASRWVADAVALAGAGGRVVAFDYASPLAELVARPWTEWVRTYRGHQRGTSAFEDLGQQDITCEVATDRLRPRPSQVTTQADWLRGHGIEELVAEGRRVWEERAAIGDLEAIRARSRVTEAEALLDPTGLGSFVVLEWDGR